MVVGYGGEVNDKYSSDGAITGNVVLGGGPYIVTVRERELGSGGGYVEDAGWVPSLGGPEDSRVVISESCGGGMGVVIGCGSIGVG